MISVIFDRKNEEITINGLLRLDDKQYYMDENGVWDGDAVTENEEATE